MTPGSGVLADYTLGVNLILSGRGVDLDEPLRRYATEKLTRVQRFFDGIIRMEVELTHERNRHGAHRVEVTVKTPRETIRSHGDGPDHFAAIDKASDRLEVQIKRFKDRLRNRSHREPRPAATIGEESEGAQPLIRRRSQQLAKPLTPDEARLELESRGLAFLLFTNAESMRPAVIYRMADDGFGLIEHEG